MRVALEMSVALLRTILGEIDPKSADSVKTKAFDEFKVALDKTGEAIVSGFLTKTSKESAGNTRNTKAGPVADAWIKFPKKVAESSGIGLARVSVFRPTQGAITLLQAGAKLQSISGQSNNDLIVVKAHIPLGRILTSLEEGKKTKAGNTYLDLTAREIGLSAIASYRRVETTPAWTTAENVVNELGF